MIAVMTNRTQDPFQYVRLTPAQLDAAFCAHEAFLAGRRPRPGNLLRFAWAPGMSCDARRLHDADFTGSHLKGSSFIGADLRRASLYCVNLSQCDFRRARMDRADLRGAKLAGANLAGAILDEADMRAGVLCGTNRPGELRVLGPGQDSSHPSRANLDDAEAHAVDFSNASLRGARLRNANLKNANFTNANLDGAILTGAKLSGSRFDGAILTGIDTTALGLSKAVLATCVVDPSEEAIAALGDIRRELDLAHAWVSQDGRAGRPARLDGLDLRPAAGLLSGRLLVGLSAAHAMAVGVDFSHSELAGANFEGADLRGADFTSCDLRGASFRNAKLTHAAFRGANLAALPLRDGGVQPTVFEGATLDGTGVTLRGPPSEPQRQSA
jgi:uncharacterized protein YjbI with pentapeptide repeats